MSIRIKYERPDGEVATVVAPVTIGELAQTLTQKQVESVYSGRPGCACGCRGKYSYNPEYRVEASKRRGYEVATGECNAGMVTRVVKMFRADPTGWSFCDDQGEVLAMNTDTRVYTMHLMPKSQ